jgi:pimeloyl-ACP methyl ester carboxylesterase
MRVLAVHGMPTSPRLFEKVQLPEGWTLTAPPVPGLGPEGTAPGWTIEGAAESLRALADEHDILVGHDLGGPVVAFLAKPGQTVVLSGTALGLYWRGIQATTLPGLRRFFYETYSGRRFLADGCLPEHARDLVEAFGQHGADWPQRMQAVARGMQVPAFLALRLRSCGVRLAWGRRDPWYPPWIARTMKRTTGGTLTWLESGHFAPWEDPRGFAAVITGTAFVR